jgi:hypothetical protein
MNICKGLRGVDIDRDIQHTSHNGGKRNTGASRFVPSIIV